GTVVARPGGDDAALTVTLSPGQFALLACNRMTLNGFLVARSLAFRGGGLTDVSVWDSIWIALLEGWPATGPTIAFEDRDGAPLDLARIFTPQDDRADAQHFLAEAGYLHLRGWLDPTDMATISADMDHALALVREGDGLSWWAQVEDGSRRCVRIQDFTRFSPTTRRILDGGRWADMLALIAGQDDLVPGRHVEALVKPTGVVSGPSDVSFHRDCHLGRHAFLCARRTVGIAITSTGEGNGSLRVIAGSHRLVMPVEIAKTRPYLPVIEVATMPGDLTVHLSCTLHDSTPPRTSERRVMYVEARMADPDGTPAAAPSAEAILREQVTDIHRREAGTDIVG
ncbi:MAG: phytanoyl-CoA dioxygenase family protein, partial [Sphingomonas sp.]